MQWTSPIQTPKSSCTRRQRTHPCHKSDDTAHAGRQFYTHYTHIPHNHTQHTPTHRQPRTHQTKPNPAHTHTHRKVATHTTQPDPTHTYTTAARGGSGGHAVR